MRKRFLTAILFFLLAPFHLVAYLNIVGNFPFQPPNFLINTIPAGVALNDFDTIMYMKIITEAEIIPKLNNGSEFTDSDIEILQTQITTVLNTFPAAPDGIPAAFNTIYSDLDPLNRTNLQADTVAAIALLSTWAATFPNFYTFNLINTPYMQDPNPTKLDGYLWIYYLYVTSYLVIDNSTESEIEAYFGVIENSVFAALNAMDTSTAFDFEAAVGFNVVTAINAIIDSITSIPPTFSLYVLVANMPFLRQGFTLITPPPFDSPSI